MDNSNSIEHKEIKMLNLCGRRARCNFIIWIKLDKYGFLKCKIWEATITGQSISVTRCPTASSGPPYRGQSH